jgi:hypothetical protein
MSPTIKGSQIRDETIETNDIKDNTIEGQDVNTTGSFTMGALGIGTAPSSYELEVAGNVGLNEYIVHNGDTDTYIRFTDDKIVLKAGDISFTTLHKQGSAPHYATINDGSNNIDFIVKGNGSNEGNPLLICDASTGRVGINGVGSPSYELDVDGDIGLGEYIYHKGDDDTFIRFQADDITVKAGNVSFINITEDDSQDKISFNEGRADLDFIVRSPSESLALYLNAGNEVFHINHGETGFKTKIHSTNGEAITVNDSGVIFNEDGHSSNDLRVESDTDTHLLFVDSSADKIGISTSSPDCTLNVAGGFAASGPSKTFQTFANSDYTPSLANGNLFKTYDATYQGATSFDDGVAGQIVTIISTNDFTYMVDAGNLKGGTTDITTADGDVTTWVYDGTYWYLMNFMDQSADLSGGH